eukprot:383344-Hanusia_phi.AAC.3
MGSLFGNFNQQQPSKLPPRVRCSHGQACRELTGRAACRNYPRSLCSSSRPRPSSCCHVYHYLNKSLLPAQTLPVDPQADPLGADNSEALSPADLLIVTAAPGRLTARAAGASAGPGRRGPDGASGPAVATSRN